MPAYSLIVSNFLSYSTDEVHQISDFPTQVICRLKQQIYDLLPASFAYGCLSRSLSETVLGKCHAYKLLQFLGIDKSIDITNFLFRVITSWRYSFWDSLYSSNKISILADMVPSPLLILCLTASIRGRPRFSYSLLTLHPAISSSRLRHLKSRCLFAMVRFSETSFCWSHLLFVHGLIFRKGYLEPTTNSILNTYKLLM